MGVKEIVKKTTNWVMESRIYKGASEGMSSGWKMIPDKKIYRQKIGDVEYEYGLKDLAADYVKDDLKDALKKSLTDAIKKGTCETILNEIMDQVDEDPDWVNKPEYRWGNGEGVTGYLEVLDITGML